MFKPLDKVTVPDERYDAMYKEDGAGGFTPMTLADHHAMVAAVDIRGAPPEIRSMFNRARHAFLYAWFDYELTPLAELQALATLEAALKVRFKAEKGTLYPLARRAVKEGLFPPMLGMFETPAILSHLRNHWAHGNSGFGSPSMALNTLEWCAELTDALFPAP